VPRASELDLAAMAAGNSSHSIEWPTHFRDQPLTQLPLGEVEQRFARRFPGAIARFTDGERVLIVRQVTRPTRQLHPATDCFRALASRSTGAAAMDDQETLELLTAAPVIAGTSASASDSAGGSGPTFPPGSGRRNTAAGPGARSRSSAERVFMSGAEARGGLLTAACAVATVQHRRCRAVVDRRPRDVGRWTTTFLSAARSRSTCLIRAARQRARDVVPARRQTLTTSAGVVRLARDNGLLT
jgi:hypothetical protein